LIFFNYGAPKRTRTSSLQIRSLMLYPIELWAQKPSGAGKGIRTLDPDLGKVVLYH
jgi:hypothetical protein